MKVREKFFEVVKPGGAELKWGWDGNRAWLCAVCKLCGKDCGLSVGRLRGGAPRAASMADAFGYAVIRRHQPRGRTWRGWRTTVVKDICTHCIRRIGRYIDGATKIRVGNTIRVLRLPDLTEDDIRFYYQRFLNKYFPNKVGAI